MKHLDAVADPSASDAVRYALVQRIRYEYSAPVRRLRQRLMVVPRAVHGGQRRLGWSIEVDGVEDATVRTRRDQWGNHVIDVDAAEVPAFIEFIAETAVSASAGPIPARADSRYLRPTRLTQAAEVVDDIARPAEPPDPAAICARTHDALAYEWGITGVHTTATEALALGRGVCQDYAHIMLAACRLVGLPARYVSGHMLGEGGSHAWVEVLRPARDSLTGWIAEAWDPTHDRRAGIGYVSVAVGRDYADVAPLSGTFEAGGVASTLHVTKAATAA